MTRAIDLDLPASAQHDVDLLLTINVMVVACVMGRIRWQVDHLHPKRLDPKRGAGTFEPPENDRRDVVDAEDSVIGHSDEAGDKLSFGRSKRRHHSLSRG